MTRLLCAQGEPLPDGEQYQNTVSVTITSKYNGCGIPSFSFDVPFVTEAYRNGPYVEGSQLLLRGLHFRWADLTPSAGIAAGADATTDLAPTCSWTSITTIACAANRVQDVSKTATVTVASTVGTGMPIYTFDAAIPTSRIGNSPHSGGALATVTGLHFGTVQSALAWR